MKMVMPKMGMTMEEGTIVGWKKKEGEYVEKGEIILEIMTNKVNIDVEAPASGFLKILRGIDDVIPVGEVIATISEEAEEEGVAEVGPVSEEISAPEEIPDIAALIEKERVPAEKPVATVSGEPRRVPASPRARKLAEELGIPLEEITGTGPGGAVTGSDVLEKREKKEKPVPAGASPPSAPPSPQAVSPLAERIARQRGVDLSHVRGTGIGGKITKEDVLRYIEGPPAAAPGIEIPDEGPLVEVEAMIAPTEAPPSPEVVPAAPIVTEPKPEIPKPEPEVAEPEGIPLTGIKKLTAERMVKSKREAPHLTLGMEVDMTEASKLKTSLKISYTDILVKATALALKKYPVMNSTLQNDRIVLRESINIGVAVARDEDLLVPVIHDADTRSLKEISHITRDVIQRTRNDELTEKDVLDGTFTISNLGMYDIDFFTPIINPPEAAILGVGAIKKKPVVIHDTVHIREGTTLSLSFDHRIVNGVPAALFLKEIKELIEHPYKLLVEGEP
jgi:pyruvate dehydrogenase E2 component (dihydrolipoamide acetyltransferase)